MTPRASCEASTRAAIGQALRELIRREGHRLRVYVPFGANWYAYSLRRLKENPSIAGYFFADMLSRKHG